MTANPRNQSSKPPIILASASPRRAELLREAGYQFTVMPSPHDEPSDFPAGTTPVEQAKFLSRFKAENVARLVTDGLVLGADTIAALGGEVFGKPRDRADAERILRTLCGTAHDVITGVTLIDVSSGKVGTRHDVTRVTMRRLSNRDLNEYLETGAWQAKAGAYGIQDHDDPFVESIEGSFTNVVGLPLELLAEMMATRY